MRFEPGRTIVERGIFEGKVGVARPLTVVAHDGDVLASALAVGTRYHGPLFRDRKNAYIDFFRGEVEFGEKVWDTHNVLILVRPDDPYSVMGFWNEAGDFVGWYVNLQAPATWTHFGFDTQDHALDIVVGEDLKSWMWKDEDELALCVEQGLYTAEKGTAIRRAGEAVIELIESGATWWGDWRSWSPDPRSPMPSLPDGWDVL